MLKFNYGFGVLSRWRAVRACSELFNSLGVGPLQLLKEKKTIHSINSSINSIEFFCKYYTEVLIVRNV